MQEFMTILTDNLKDMIENEGVEAESDIDFEQGYFAGYTKALMTVEDYLNE